MSGIILSGDASHVTAPLGATISALANNGSGAVRATTSAPHLFATADVVQVDTPIIAGTFTITVIDATHFDLVGSTYSSTAVGIATDLSLTPQFQAPVDGDTGSLQLSGLLSSLQALADRDQYLARALQRCEEPPPQNLTRAGAPATASGVGGDTVTAMAWDPNLSQWLMGTTNSGGGCSLLVGYGKDVDLLGSWKQVGGGTISSTNTPVVKCVAAHPVTAGTFIAVAAQGGASPYTDLLIRSSVANASWTTKRTITGSGTFWTDARIITFAGRTIIACGTTITADVLFTSSSDGFTTSLDTTPAGTIPYWRLAASGNVCLAVPYFQVTFGAAQQAFSWTTPDGINWTRNTLAFLGAHDQCVGVIWDPLRSVFVMAVQTAINSGVTCAFYTSPDGAAWTLQNVGPNLVAIADMGVIGSYYVCSELDVGDAGPSQTMWSSDGGLTWFFGQPGFSSNVGVANFFRYAAPQYASPPSPIGLAYFNTLFFRFSPLVGRPTHHL